MSSVPIQALDEVRVPYALPTVWAVLRDYHGYARWWPWAARVRVLEAGAEDGGVGTDLEIRPFGGPPFRCRVVEVEEGRRIRMAYHDGLVTGRAAWEVETVPSGTRVAYRLDARAGGRLVVLAARVLDLRAIHSWQMGGVLRGLQRELAARDERRR